MQERNPHVVGARPRGFVDQSNAARLQFREPRFVGLITATALCGPVIGVGFYQWALATTPSGIVLPIVALTPITIIPLSWWLEGDRPKARSLIGGAVAVASAIALAWARSHAA